jgi:hypothetical protein
VGGAAGAHPERHRPVEPLGTHHTGGTAGAEWMYRYKHDPENPLKEKPKYFFTANGVRCKEVKSGNVEIFIQIYIQMMSADGMVIPEAEGVLIQGDTEKEISITDGYYEEKEQIPGLWRFKPGKLENKDTGKAELRDTVEAYHRVLKSTAELKNDGIEIPQTGEKLLIILDREKEYS